MAAAVGLVCAAANTAGQSGAPNRDWPTYGGDLRSTRYLPPQDARTTN